jgi:hypothetical protein
VTRSQAGAGRDDVKHGGQIVKIPRS